MAAQDFEEIIEVIREEDPRFAKGAYFFVRQALDHTLKKVKKPSKPGRASKHVSGQELLEGIRDFALEHYGPMAKTLFDHWGVTKSSDFGDIVFNLVEWGVLGKTEQDKPEDFQDVYDFDEAFVKPFLPEKPRRIHLPTPQDSRPREN
jgi:uncharacterized repeat protein (TIGR04138 family)